ncbi:MAG: 30S ribosomal protein S3 [bacterium]
MSHTVHPYSHRLVVLRDWKSRWFGTRGKYQEYLKTDIILREFLQEKLRGSQVDSVDMERGTNLYKIIIKTAKPGLVIGRSGEGTAKLKDKIVSILKKNKISIPKEIRIEVEEVRSPETHSAIVGEMIAEGLEKRLPFMRVVKQALEKTMASRDVLGARVTISGRLGGAEMSRVETVKKGRLPLQTLRADIDFAKEKAHLPYGDIGIKVWIYKGEIFADKKKTNTNK